MIFRISIVGSSAQKLRSRQILSRGMSGVSDEPILAGSSKIIAPWLMLPPAFDSGGTVAFKFASLAEKETFTISSLLRKEDVVDIKVVGSSHGWLALYNRKTSHLSLFNPLSGRHIKLPPLEDVVHDRFALSIFKVVISSPTPHEKDCWALMLHGSGNWYSGIAFCSPGCRGSKWTPFVSKFLDGPGSMYDDFVYSPTQKLVYGVSSATPYIWILDPQARESPLTWFHGRSMFDMASARLIFVEDSGELFMVRRQLRDSDSRSTVSFKVFRMPPKEGMDWQASRVLMEGTLGGLAVFVDAKHSIALPTGAGEFPGLMPDSIYFTEEECGAVGKWKVSIFNYRDGTFSTCYDAPTDDSSIRNIMPGPMWFTPAPSG